VVSCNRAASVRVPINSGDVIVQRASSYMNSNHRCNPGKVWILDQFHDIDSRNKGGAHNIPVWRVSLENSRCKGGTEHIGRLDVEMAIPAWVDIHDKGIVNRAFIETHHIPEIDSGQSIIIWRNPLRRPWQVELVYYNNVVVQKEVVERAVEMSIWDPNDDQNAARRPRNCHGRSKCA
jgi:hypothetical protein